MRKPLLSSETVHATSVAIGGRAVLLAGRSGSGKSDLALRLIDRGAILVSDDYTLVRRADMRLMAMAPATIAGRLEIRGLGIVAVPHAAEARVALLIELDQPVARMPDEPLPARQLAGVAIPLLALAPFESSAAIKVERALARFGLPPEES